MNKENEFTAFEITEIMNIPFSKMNLADTVKYLSTRIEQKKLTHVVTANPEIVMYAKKDSAYEKLLLSADIIVPDGVGIVYASRLRKNPVTERVAGYDLLLQLAEQANVHQWKVYLLGANEEVNKLAFERLKEKYPGAYLIGRHHGYFIDDSKEEKEVIEEIKQIKPDIIFVALGFPRQEQWIHKYKNELLIPLMMGVGGSLDVVSGKVKRAPVIWQKLGLEWLHRLTTMPSRWRRMLVLPIFMMQELYTSIWNRK